jgi:GNAT superfamily N-acetyltransferase
MQRVNRSRSKIRPAGLEDIPAIRALLAAYGNDSPVTTVDIVGPYVRHLIEHAVAVVTEHDDAIVAFGATIDAGVAAHLTDLFVRPDLVGQGIGRALLAVAFEGTARRTTFASSDPRAIPLYVRSGMAPLWPLLYLEGRADALPGIEAPLAVVSDGPARLDRLERTWRGVERPSDHAFWGAQAEARSFVVLDGGEPVAFGYSHADQASDARVLDRLVVHPAANPLRPTIAAIRAIRRSGLVKVCVPGPNPALPALLAAHFRITDIDQYMASEPDLVDPARLMPSPGML